MSAFIPIVRFVPSDQTDHGFSGENGGKHDRYDVIQPVFTGPETIDLSQIYLEPEFLDKVMKRPFLWGIRGLYQLKTVHTADALIKDFSEKTGL